MRVRRPDGIGEVLALRLRPDRAFPFDKMSHIDTLEHAMAQLPEHERQQVLVCTDTGCCSKAFLHHITDLGLQYSIGFPALGPAVLRPGPGSP